MQTAKEKAEAYVRQALPELMELSLGCEIYDHDELIDWARTQRIVHYDTQKSVLVARENDGSTYRKSTTLEGYKIIGHPIQLQHWLRVFENISTRFIYYLNLDGELIKCVGEKLDVPTHAMWFNLTTGQPATEVDFKAFCDIIGI